MDINYINTTGCLSSVTELGLSDYHMSQKLKGGLPFLKILRFNTYYGRALRLTADAIKRRLLPSLKTVCIAGNPDNSNASCLDKKAVYPIIMITQLEFHNTRL